MLFVVLQELAFFRLCQAEYGKGDFAKADFKGDFKGQGFKGDGKGPPPPWRSAAATRPPPPPQPKEGKEGAHIFPTGGFLFGGKGRLGQMGIVAFGFKSHVCLNTQDSTHIRGCERV